MVYLHLGGFFLLRIQKDLYAKRFVCRFVCKNSERNRFIFLYLYFIYCLTYKTYKRNRNIRVERHTTLF